MCERVSTNNSIPKVIHYIWFGGKPLPASAERCVASWRKFFPDYEIKKWDESNYDVNKIPYTRDAYKAGKYAFVSDYARFDILYHEGGLYFDTDVEVIRPMDDIVAAGSFMGCENVSRENETPDRLGVAPGLGLGAIAGLEIYKELCDIYLKLDFSSSGRGAAPETVVTYTTRLMCDKGLKNSAKIQQIGNVLIYPSEFFSPKSTEDGKLRITGNTRSIHHYDQSWQSPMRKYGRRVILALGGTKLKQFVKRLLYTK